MLSTDPCARAVFIRERPITSGSSFSLRIFCTDLALTKSHRPSLATTINLWLRRIQTFFTSGLTTSPIFFRPRSPKARVIASNPPSLPIRIFPPAYSYPNNYLFHSCYLRLVVASVLGSQLFTGVVIEEVGRGVADVCDIEYPFGLFESEEADGASRACLEVELTNFLVCLGYCWLTDSKASSKSCFPFFFPLQCIYLIIYISQCAPEAESSPGIYSRPTLRVRRRLRRGKTWDNFRGSSHRRRILDVGSVTVFHGLPMGKVGLVEVSERAEGSPILIDLPVLPLLQRAPEHYIKLNIHPHPTHHKDSKQCKQRRETATWKLSWNKYSSKVRKRNRSAA